MTIVFHLLAVLPSADQPWPQFRGPTGQGHSTSTALPTRFGPNENVVWKQSIAGEGWSSPIAAAGKVFLTAAVPADAKNPKGDRSLRLLALDSQSGAILWDKEIFKETAASSPKIHSKNSHATPTPVCDGGMLFVHFGHQGTACVNASDGDVLWSTREFAYRPVHGGGSSPVLAGKLVILTCDAANDPFLVALDRDTGSVVWRTPRKTDAKKTFSFCTPLVIENEGKPVLVTPGSNVVCGLDPATGAEIWRVRYDGYSVVPRPVAGDGLVYLSTGFESPRALAIRLGGKGDVTESNIEWQYAKAAPATPSMLLVGRELFMCSDRGVASCLDAKDGSKIWQERLLGPTSASPIDAAGMIYWFDENGKGVVFKASRKLETAAKIDLGERTFASPAVYGDKLLIRTEKHLYCFGATNGVAARH
jgi:outer membrane protein assembly factor BamB